MLEEITLKFKLETNKSISLLGYYFIDNNKKNVKIKING